MRLRCKKNYIGIGRIGYTGEDRFVVGKFYEVLEKRSNQSNDEYWLFKISGESKRDYDVEVLNRNEVYEYFETLEETRDNKLNEILK